MKPNKLSETSSAAVTLTCGELRAEIDDVGDCQLYYHNDHFFEIDNESENQFLLDLLAILGRIKRKRQL